MLARQPQGGGAPRDIIDRVEYADWSPDGSGLAVVHRVGGKVRIEYPVGKVIYETAGWVSYARVSPSGKLVAFLDHPYSDNDGGSVAIIDLSGKKKSLNDSYVTLEGLAWRPDGDEIWFTGTKFGNSRELHAVTLDGKERLVFSGTGTLTLHDISKQGRVLLSRDDTRSGAAGLAPGAKSEIDLSWADWTNPRDISDDGKLFAFDESGDAGGDTGVIYVRPTDGSPAIRLGKGLSPTLSPDGKWVLAAVAAADGKYQMTELPTGAGESRPINTGDIQASQDFFFPDGHHVLMMGIRAGEHAMRMFVFDLNGGAPRPLGPEGAIINYRGCISKDGAFVAALDPDRRPTIYEVATGKATPIPGVIDGDEPNGWVDEKHVLVGRAEIPRRVFSIDISTGKRTLFKTFSPADPIGVVGDLAPIFSADLKSYVYTYARIISDLYILDGLK